MSGKASIAGVSVARSIDGVAPSTDGVTPPSARALLEAGSAAAAARSIDADEAEGASMVSASVAAENTALARLRKAPARLAAADASFGAPAAAG